MLLAILYLIIYKVTWRFYFIILLSRLNIFYNYLNLLLNSERKQTMNYYFQESAQILTK